MFSAGNLPAKWFFCQKRICNFMKFLPSHSLPPTPCIRPMYYLQILSHILLCCCCYQGAAQISIWARPHCQFWRTKRFPEAAELSNIRQCFLGCGNMRIHIYSYSLRRFLDAYARFFCRYLFSKHHHNLWVWVARRSTNSEHQKSSSKEKAWT